MQESTTVWTAAVVGVAGLSYAIVGQFWALLVQGPSGIVVIGAALAVASIVAERFSMPPRFLGAKVQYLGVVLLVAGSIGAWGGWVLAPLAAGLCIAAPVYFWQRSRAGPRGWLAAQKALERARESAEAGEIGKTWGHLQSAFYVPDRGALESDVREHDRAVLELLSEAQRAMIGQADLARLVELAAALKEDDATLDDPTARWVRELLETQGVPVGEAPGAAKESDAA